MRIRGVEDENQEERRIRIRRMEDENHEVLTNTHALISTVQRGCS